MKPQWVVNEQSGAIKEVAFSHSKRVTCIIVIGDEEVVDALQVVRLA